MKERKAKEVMMDWDNAIKECPSNKDGKCNILPGQKTCEENVADCKCAIVKLREHMEDAMNLPKTSQDEEK